MSPARLTTSINWMFPGMTAEQAYPAARRMGFRAMEHSFPYDLSAADTAALLERSELDLALMYAPCRYSEGEKGYACVPGREAEFARGFDEALAYARVVKCRTLGVLVGEIPEGVEKALCLEVLRGNLAHAADAARAEGVTLSIEPICSQRIPRFALNTVEQTASLVAAVDRENIGICYDTFQVAMEQGSLIEQFDRYRAQINYLQIANSPVRLGPGQGELDLLFFTDYVLGKGWDGWLSCEYSVDSAARPESVLAWTAGHQAQGRLRV